MSNLHPSVSTATSWIQWLPGLALLRSYKLSWLPRDIIAGLVLTTMLAPVGVAYAIASGVGAINGLYATVACLLAYAVFGPSRILVLGPDSSLATIILGVVAPLSAGDPGRAVALAGVMALVSGTVLVLAGIARLGFVTDLLSKPIRYGYMNGIALTVLISQLPKLFGFKIEGAGPLRDIWMIAGAIAGGKANWSEFALGGATLVGILLVKRSKRFPGVLTAMLGATAIVYFFDLAERANVSVLGSLPSGLPTLSIPWISIGDFLPIAIGGCAVALVSFADTSVLSRTYAARTGSRVDPNQEMVGLGAANLAAGLFQGFPISSSSSRTPVAETAGARTQVTGVVGAVAVALVLLWAPNLLKHVPTAALAGVVISSAIGLIEVDDLGRLFRIQRWEFWLSIVCFAGVAVFGAIQGVGIALVIAIIQFLWDGWRPHSAVLGRVEGIRGYHDITRYPQARQVPGLVLFRWDAPLFFANAEFFKERVLGAVGKAPAPVRWLVVAAEPVTSVDVTAADVLSELNEALRDKGVKLAFAELKDPVKDKLKQIWNIRSIRRRVLLCDNWGCCRRIREQTMTRSSPMLDPINFSVIGTLRNGKEIEIRAQRPQDRNDLEASILRMSNESLYRRFFGAKHHFSEREADYFLKIDFVSHAALVAVAHENGKPAIVGAGRYVVVEPGAAEVAFGVIDERRRAYAQSLIDRAPGGSQ